MFFFRHLEITLIPMTTWSSHVDKSNMAAEKSCPLKHLKLNKCFIHFDDVSQSLTKITEARLKKFVACRARWAELGQKSDICRQTYKLFSDENVDRHFSGTICCGECNLDWYYHQNCYKRLCDENKLQKAEEKRISESGKEIAETLLALPPKKLSR